MDRLSSCKTKRNLTRSKNFRYSHTNLNCYQRTLKGLHKKWKGSGQHSGTKCRENNEIRQRALAGALWASQEPQVMPKQTNSCSSAWSCKTGKRIEVIIWIHGCIDSPYFDRPSSVMKTRVKREKSSMKHWTNLCNKGLTSADRSNKATLPLTVPRSHSSRLQRIHPRPYYDCNS